MKEEALSKYLTNFLNCLSSNSNFLTVAHSPQNTVDAFTWRDTPEGYEYWRKLDLMFIKIQRDGTN